MTVLQTFAPSTGTSAAPPWDNEQNPRIRGVVQDRITPVSGASVPGSGSDPFRPSSALRFEIRPFHSGDFTITATATATATDTVLSVSSADAAKLVTLDFFMNTRTGEVLRVSTTPSGTTVPVLRAQNTAAAAINVGDTFTVFCGDVNDSDGSYATSRAEVLGDLPSPTSTPVAQWPNPPGAVRWYHWSSYVPSDFTPAIDGTWLTSFQLKGLYGGSPPLGMEIQRTNWRFSGSRGNGWTDAQGTHAPAFVNNGVIGPYNAGSWTDFIVGVKLSTDPNLGWVEVWMNRQVVIPKQFLATLDTKNNDGVTPDPVYLKTGIYRDTNWNTTAVLYHGPLTVADSSLDFGVASSPPPGTSPISGEHWGALG